MQFPKRVLPSVVPEDDIPPRRGGQERKCVSGPLAPLREGGCRRKATGGSNEPVCSHNGRARLRPGRGRDKARPSRFRALFAAACGLLLAAAAHAAPPIDCALSVSPSGAWVRQFAPPAALPPGADPATATLWGPARPRPLDAVTPALSPAPSHDSTLLWHTSDLTADVRYDLRPAANAYDFSATLRISNHLSFPLRPRELLLVEFDGTPPNPAPRRPLADVDPSIPLSAPWLPPPPPPPASWLPISLPPPALIPQNSEISVEITVISNAPVAFIDEFDWRTVPVPTPKNGAPAAHVAEVALPSDLRLPPGTATLPDASPAATPGSWHPGTPLRLVAAAPDSLVRAIRLRPVATLLPGGVRQQTHTITLVNDSDTTRSCRLLEAPDAARGWHLDSASIPSETDPFRPGLHIFRVTLAPHSSTNLTLTLRAAP